LTDVEVVQNKVKKIQEGQDKLKGKILNHIDAVFGESPPNSKRSSSMAKKRISNKV
jgi:hypothetical protein